MYVCMYVCMHVCMYACVYIYAGIQAYMCMSIYICNQRAHALVPVPPNTHVQHHERERGGGVRVREERDLPTLMSDSMRRCPFLPEPAYVSIRQHTSANVSIRQRMSACSCPTCVDVPPCLNLTKGQSSRKKKWGKKA